MKSKALLVLGWVVTSLWFGTAFGLKRQRMPTVKSDAYTGFAKGIDPKMHCLSSIRVSMKERRGIDTYQKATVKIVETEDHGVAYHIVIDIGDKSSKRALDGNGKPKPLGKMHLVRITETGDVVERRHGVWGPAADPALLLTVLEHARLTAESHKGYFPSPESPLMDVAEIRRNRELAMDEDLHFVDMEMGASDL